MAGFEPYKLKFALSFFCFVNSIFLPGAYIFKVILFSEPYCIRNEKCLRLSSVMVR